jgi:hypothetical protein
MSLDKMDEKFIHLDKVLAFILGNIWSSWAWKSDYFRIAKAVALLALIMSEILCRLLVIHVCKKAQLILSKDQKLCCQGCLISKILKKAALPTNG